MSPSPRRERLDVFLKPSLDSPDAGGREHTGGGEIPYLPRRAREALRHLVTCHKAGQIVAVVEILNRAACAAEDVGPQEHPVWSDMGLPQLASVDETAHASGRDA
jgi:hypothetical protein